MLTALSANSRFLARSYGVFHNLERIFLVMKYYKHGSLHDWLYKDGIRRLLTEKESAWVLAQMVLALEHLH